MFQQTYVRIVMGARRVMTACMAWVPGMGRGEPGACEQGVVLYSKGLRMGHAPEN